MLEQCWNEFEGVNSRSWNNYQNKSIRAQMDKSIPSILFFTQWLLHWTLHMVERCKRSWKRQYRNRWKMKDFSKSEGRQNASIWSVKLEEVRRPLTGWHGRRWRAPVGCSHRTFILPVQKNVRQFRDITVQLSYFCLIICLHTNIYSYITQFF